MPLTTDRRRIRTLLSSDRIWSLYGLGDLEPERFAVSDWHISRDGRALVLLYRAFGTPVLFAHGPAEGVEELLDEASEPEAYLSVRPEVMPAVRARYTVRAEAAMWRMGLAAAPGAVPAPPGLRRLTAADAPALGRLLDDGLESGETPDFFRLAQVRDGVFFGVEEAGELVAVAGTHLMAPSEGVAAVGNVYTRRDRRGRGLAGATTAAVCAALRAAGIADIGLNVAQGNAAAIRAYERVGFRVHCPFFEGLALRLA